MKNRVLAFVVALLLLAGAASAATTINSTTLVSEVNSTEAVINLTSASTVAAGDLLFVDREAMFVNSITSTRASVTRGFFGTAARPHAALAIVYTGPPARFYGSEVSNGGVCSSSAELYLPRIVLPTGNVYQCTNSVWQRIGSDVGSITVRCSTGPLVTGSVDQSCWTADRDYVVVKITAVWAVQESGGTVTLIPRRQQGTEAPASGDALATAVNMVATAETVTTATLATTSEYLILDAGDRLGLDFTDDTPGELKGVVVTFTLVPR